MKRPNKEDFIEPEQKPNGETLGYLDEDRYIDYLEKYIDFLQQINDLNITDVVGSDLLNAVLDAQKEIVSSPLRFNGVHIEKIKQVFAEYGIIYKPPF